MNDKEFIRLLDERMKEIAVEVYQEVANQQMQQSCIDDAAGLRSTLALIKAKERITVKEAALLLSCSESHIRKLIKLARQGKTQRPIPFADIEGVTVFPPDELLVWASPKQPLAQQSDNRGLCNKAA